MSNKPTKKTDLNKTWLKNRESKSKKIRINPEYHLIVTEGTNTEPYYFEAIKREINERYRERISVEVEGKCDNTINLFYRAKAIAEKSPNVFRHVWVVYDTDSFPAEHINRTAELCSNSATAETEYHAIWSNQCIELWFLLHFAFFHTDIDRREYWPKITDYLIGLSAGEYRKNREDMYYLLKPYLKKAINNAKKLAKLNEGKTPAASAPGTEVYKLIEMLKPYLDV